MNIVDVKKYFSAWAMITGNIMYINTSGILRDF